MLIFLEILENKMFLIVPMDQENLMETSGMPITAKASIKEKKDWVSKKI